MSNQKRRKTGPGSRVADEYSGAPSSHERGHAGEQNTQLAQKRAATGQKSATVLKPVNLAQSVLQDAHDFWMNNLNVTVNSPPVSRTVDGWKLLVKKISPNAFYDSRARYDPPKCDNDTRVELIAELMERLSDREGAQRLLCMTGPAGSGKSALQQTTAERCEKSGILGSAYFFANADFTRNTTAAVVPTIAYQLGSHHPALKRAISTAVVEDPVVFEKSLQVQMASLIVHPLRYLSDDTGWSITDLPYVILIDGLDECHDEERQGELLTAIRECLLAEDLPFCIFVASRPEWAIRTALAQGGHLHAAAYHIVLSEHDASADMRRFLQRRFKQLSHRTPNPLSFNKEDIETLVEAGSGQFVYVATVYRWISEHRASPTERLKIVLRWAPEAGETARPFEVLDRLYANILLNAKSAYEAVDTHSGRDFLLLFNIHHANAVGGLAWHPILGAMSEVSVARLLELESDSLDILISDLHSLVSIQRVSLSPSSYLLIHHKSFSDFLNAERRAKDLFVSRSYIHEHVIRCFLRHILRVPNSTSLILAMAYLPLLWTSARVPLNLDDEIIDFTQRGGWKKVNSFKDILIYKHEYHKLLEDGQTLEGIKERNPEAFEEIKMYFEEWKSECDEQEAREMEGK
ncbi:hypothetical protein MD484_g6227, partial [Candolleomyces efflorescens]